MLACGDVICPDLAWMLTRTHKHLAPVMAEVRDPERFARLVQLVESGRSAPEGRPPSRRLGSRCFWPARAG